MGQTIVFLLAGGEGARLYPLTKDRSKPAVPFGGMWRLADFTLSNCLHSGLNRIYVLTQYKSESLTRHLYQTWQFFRPALGESLNVLPPQLRETRDFYRGTADAVYQNMFTIQREGARDVVIVSGDHVYAMDYRPFIAYHHENDADLTIATFPVPRAEADDGEHEAPVWPGATRAPEPERCRRHRRPSARLWPTPSLSPLSTVPGSLGIARRRCRGRER